MQRLMVGFGIAFFVGLCTVSACGGKTTPEPVAETTAEAKAEATKEAASETVAEVAAEPVAETADAAAEAVAEKEPEVVTVGDLEKPEVAMRCQNKMADEWPFVKTPSTGAVQVTVTDGVSEATIDAAAGGSANAKRNAFVYLDLDAGQKVAVDDFAAFSDTTWELAFKRVVIRSNSGDSGLGSVKVGKLSKAKFEDIKIFPPGIELKTDISLSPTCVVLTDPIGTPRTVFNDLNPTNPTGSESWYEYGGASGITPAQGDIYILSDSDKGKSYKMQILSWAAGIYKIRWQALP